MSDRTKKPDASRRKLLLAGPSLAELGVIGLEPTVQQAQAQTPAPAPATGESGPMKKPKE